MPYWEMPKMSSLFDRVCRPNVQFSEKTSIVTGVRKATSNYFVEHKKGAELLGNTVRVR